MTFALLTFGEKQNKEGHLIGLSEGRTPRKKEKAKMMSLVKVPGCFKVKFKLRDLEVEQKHYYLYEHLK